MGETEGAADSWSGSTAIGSRLSRKTRFRGPFTWLRCIHAATETFRAETVTLRMMPKVNAKSRAPYLRDWCLPYSADPIQALRMLLQPILQLQDGSPSHVQLRGSLFRSVVVGNYK